MVLAGDSEIVEELAPAARQRKAKGARSAPRRRKRNILLHRRHDSHRVSPNNWPTRTPHRVALSALAHPCAAEESTKAFWQTKKV
ncbi:hypothetical protein [Ureibacillus sp. GCM10028918]|uniref:hypothetical protein n=1 Tax=Ureibacillus sp. GCM10028918 TaxID=3273429 RepID=UPI0036244328